MRFPSPHLLIYSSIYTISQGNLSGKYCKHSNMFWVWATQRHGCGPHFLSTELLCVHISYPLHTNLKPVDLFYHVLEASTVFRMIKFLSECPVGLSVSVQNKHKETKNKTTCQKSDITASLRVSVPSSWNVHSFRLTWLLWKTPENKDCRSVDLGIKWFYQKDCALSINLPRVGERKSETSI